MTNTSRRRSLLGVSALFVTCGAALDLERSGYVSETGTLTVPFGTTAAAISV